MGKFIERVHAEPGRIVWLDATDYAAALFAGGQVPWLDAIALVAWYRKMQGLLNSDVVTIPVWRIAMAWLDAHPELRVSMAARSRAVYPLRTLLADESVRSHIGNIGRALRSSIGDAVLVLALPSPRRAVAAAYHLAFPDGLPVEVGEDETDAAAPYIADFLREFADVSVDALLLEEDARSEPVSPAEVAWYQSVFNVTAHYRWDVGLRVPGERYPSGASGPAFVIGPRPESSAVAGLEVSLDFWDGAEPPRSPESGFRFAVIPARAQPEFVLERLALLR